MKFRAAVLVEQGKPLAIEDLEFPHLKAGQVALKIHRSGICGAQLGEQSGTKGPDKFLPHLCGHEGFATVLEVGAGVKNVKMDDKVVVHWRKGIGIEAEYPKYKTPKGKTIGGGANTTFQEMSVVSENRLTRVDVDTDPDVAALMGCAVTTGLGVVTNEAMVKIGESAIVFGAGGVGINVIQGLELVSASPIVAVDLYEHKLEMAKQFGASHVFNSRMNDTKLVEWTVPLVNKQFDVAIDTTGVPSVIEQAYGMARRVWLVAQVRFDQKVSLQTIPMNSGREIHGSDGGGTNPTVDIPRYLRLHRCGRLKLDTLVTHRGTLDDVNDLFTQIRAGQVGRAIIDFGNKT